MKTKVRVTLAKCWWEQLVGTYWKYCAFCRAAGRKPDTLPVWAERFLVRRINYRGFCDDVEVVAVEGPFSPDELEHMYLDYCRCTESAGREPETLLVWAGQLFASMSK